MNATVGKKMNETCLGRHSEGYKTYNGDYHQFLSEEWTTTSKHML